ncbi:MAG: hypothetical protein QM715_01825 [Nibricoccus sp.]
MKIPVLLCLLCALLGGCARKSELEKTRAQLAEAQRKIEQLENERVPRAQYDIARASLRIADERISTLEKNLNAAYDLMAEQQITPPTELASANSSPTSGTPATPPTNFHLANGGYIVTNDTHVYSADSELALGKNLKVSSPTGLMVTDTEQRIVGGDLAIKAKGVTMASEDGLLMTNADGTVKFTGSNLTMKFDEKKETPNQPAEALALPPQSERAPLPSSSQTTSGSSQVATGNQ